MTQKHRYLVVGPLEEMPVNVANDDLDGLICLGDLLQFAPPPHCDPRQSLLAELDERTPELYAAENVSAIIKAIREASDDEQIHDYAKDRYRSLFSEMEGPLFYLYGNQDVPESLAAVAYQTEKVRHASSHNYICSVDGAVPAFADIPPGTFPCECSRKEFYYQVATASAPILAAHSLPAEFEPEEYGFEVALSATDGEAKFTDSVARLPSFRRSEAVAELTITVDSGNRSPTITLSESTHTNVTRHPSY